MTSTDNTGQLQTTEADEFLVPGSFFVETPPSEEETMANTEARYDVRNDDYYYRLANARFFKVRDMKALSRQLMTVDYSVIASRREGHDYIKDFLKNGVDGETLFDGGNRFPGSVLDQYICDDDSFVNNLLISLTSVLSYRVTNSAKDTDAGTGNGKKESNVALAFDQGAQDNTKRFEELQKQLVNVPRDTKLVWNRKSFESAIHGKWVENPPRA